MAVSLQRAHTPVGGTMENWYGAEILRNVLSALVEMEAVGIQYRGRRWEMRDPDCRSSWRGLASLGFQSLL